MFGSEPVRVTLMAVLPGVVTACGFAVGWPMTSMVTVAGALVAVQLRVVNVKLSGPE